MKHSWFDDTEEIRKMNDLFPPKEGWVGKKKGEEYVKRFLVLEGRTLRYYRDENGQKKLRGCINFPLYSCQIVHYSHECSFRIFFSLGSVKVFDFKSKS